MTIQTTIVQVAYVASRSQDAVSSVAICAGSGADLLLGNPADVYLTGEMSHHEVLEAVASGHHVILCTSFPIFYACLLHCSRR